MWNVPFGYEFVSEIGVVFVSTLYFFYIGIAYKLLIGRPLDNELCILIIFRIFSRNIKARRKENSIFEWVIKYPKKKFKLFYNIIKNYNHALYKRCPKCKQMIKLPLKKGKHQVICPTCKHEFTVKCNRNEKVKVEILKNR